MSKKKKEMDELAPIIRGLKVDVDRTGIEKELQARLENKQARIVELEALTDSLRAKEGQRVDREKWELEEQERKDEASLRYAESISGGGKVRLPTESSGKYSYGGRTPYRDAVDDLYDRVEKGDKDAEYMLERMWKQAEPQIKEISRGGGLTISGCPKCNSGLIKGTDICPKCGFSLKEGGWKDYGEMWVTK